MSRFRVRRGGGGGGAEVTVAKPRSRLDNRDLGPVTPRWAGTGGDGEGFCLADLLTLFSNIYS